MKCSKREKCSSSCSAWLWTVVNNRLRYRRYRSKARPKNMKSHAINMGTAYFLIACYYIVVRTAVIRHSSECKAFSLAGHMILYIHATEFVFFQQTFSWLFAPGTLPNEGPGVRFEISCSIKDLLEENDVLNALGKEEFFFKVIESAAWHRVQSLYNLNMCCGGTLTVDMGENVQLGWDNPYACMAIVLFILNTNRILFLLGVTCALAPGTWRSTAL